MLLKMGLTNISQTQPLVLQVLKEKKLHLKEKKLHLKEKKQHLKEKLHLRKRKELHLRRKRLLKKEEGSFFLLKRKLQVSFLFLKNRGFSISKTGLSPRFFYYCLF